MIKEDKIRRIWYGTEQPGWALLILSKIFSKLAALRRRLYKLGLLKSHKLSAPVIVIGNITAGGGGKTPMVIWLVNYLKEKGYKPGIVSRGHGGKRKVEPMFVTAHADAQASGDEPLLMAQHTGVPVMVGKSRVKAAQALIKQYKVNIIVSDDGMQHYAMHRDAEIVMLDAAWQTGNQQFIPAGPLREPLSRLEQVDMTIYKGIVEGKHHFRYQIDRIYRLNKASEAQDIESFRGKKIHAIAGIANPNSFFSLLAENGLAVVKHPLPDHHQIQATELEQYTEPNSVFMMTEKDAVKCIDLKLDNIWVVRLKISLHKDSVQAIDQLIKKATDKKSKL